MASNASPWRSFTWPRLRHGLEEHYKDGVDGKRPQDSNRCQRSCPPGQPLGEGVPAQGTTDHAYSPNLPRCSRHSGFRECDRHVRSMRAFPELEKSRTRHCPQVARSPCTTDPRRHRPLVTGSFYSTGSLKRKTAPLPSAASTSRSPFWARARSRAMAKPRPVPPLERLLAVSIR